MSNEPPIDRPLSEPDDGSLDEKTTRRLPGPPPVPAASREQIEGTWKAIVTHLEDHAARADRAGADRQGERSRRAIRWSELSRWLQPPSFGEWRLARVGALVATGFVVAWYAAGQGWLPGTAPVETPPVARTAPTDATAPDRSWLAADDYSDRLEALLLGLARPSGDDVAAVTPVAREVGRELLSDNRFYRRVAERNNDRSLSDLLARVEIVLLALATAPAGQEEEVVQSVRQFIGESNLLPDLRGVRSSVPPNPRKTVSTKSS